MTERGPDSREPGPRSVSAEDARRRLYMPGGASTEAVGEFLRLELAAEAEAIESVEAPPEAEEPEDEEPGAPAPAVRGRRRPSRRVVLVAAVAAAAIVVVVLAAILRAVGPRALPTTVPIPHAAGTFLMDYSRMSDPQSAPRFVTFEPDSYQTYRAGGRRVRIVLRCIGAGPVRISATQFFSYTFDCTSHETVQVRTTASGTTHPFLILGRTVGNVVWSMRIVLLPAT